VFVHLNDIFVMSGDDRPPMKIGGIKGEWRGNVLGRRGFKTAGFGVGLPNRPSGEMHE
jgi:hypothetical protein